MINLLPLEEKEEILQQENWKLLVILGIILLTFLVSLSLILFSIKIFISGEAEAQKIIFAQREKEFENPQIQGLRDNLLLFNKELLKLDSFYKNQSNLSQILEQISKTLPKGIYLNNLSIAPQGGTTGEFKCSLSGFSPDRQTLLAFKGNLEQGKIFKNINFPAINWVKQTDINFTISLAITKQ